MKGKSPNKKLPGARLPEGVDEIEATIRIAKEDFYFKTFRAHFPDGTVKSRTRQGGAIRVALSGAGSLTDGHAHFEARERGPDGSFVATLALVPGAHGKSLGGALSVAEAITAIRDSWINAPEVARILVSAHFNLSLRDWTPTLQLPFTPLSMTGELTGTPQICGVDIAFQDQGSANRLQRAFVTTYDGIDQMVIRMLLVCSDRLDETLVSALIRLVEDHLPLLARRKAVG